MEGWDARTSFPEALLWERFALFREAWRYVSPMSSLRTRNLVLLVSCFLLLGQAIPLFAQFRERSRVPGKRGPGLSGLIQRFHTEEGLPPAKRIATAAWKALLDVSGSMAAKVGTGGRTRLVLAKEALIQALTRFIRDTRFNIVFFHTRVRAWGKKLMWAVRANQEKAVRFVKSTLPTGPTNLYGALKAAFRDKDADTIYLLSDGSPTAGEVIDPAAIAKEVLSWNRTRRIVIHTISLGTSSPLLKRLAKETGGQYVRR